jgi:hypothetical protein
LADGLQQARGFVPRLAELANLLFNLGRTSEG